MVGGNDLQLMTDAVYIYNFHIFHVWKWNQREEDQATVAAPDIIYGIFPGHVKYTFRTIILLTGGMRSLRGRNQNGGDNSAMLCSIVLELALSGASSL